MKINIVLFALASFTLINSMTFDLVIEDGMVNTDEEKCYDDAKTLVELAMQLKEAKDSNQILSIILRMLPAGQDAFTSCKGMDRKKLLETIYHHLNQEGQSCWNDTKADVEDIKRLIADFKQGDLTLKEFVDRVSEVLQNLPVLVEECKKGRLD
jgi:hypothetical protein